MPRKRALSRKSGKPEDASVRRAPALLLRSTPAAPYRLKADEIERALVTGEQADLLQRYFGDEMYAELQELARNAATRSVRGGPRVLILPGMMGSTLGTPRPLLLDDVIWIDPIDIAAGRLTTLALIPGPPRHRALGVVLVAYLKLKLRLLLAGFDAGFYPYDWRQSLDTLGGELAAHVTAEPAGEVSLVAHSMGGLVSRAALQHDLQKVKRLIMLGTPNFGSFVATQALRALYPVIRKIALLDLSHSPEELTEQVFSTFPALYQLLPAPEKFSRFDLFDLNNWPAGGPRPRQALLDAARKAQAFLAPPDERFALIVGVNRDTVTDLQLANGQFAYSVSKDGDGTVPVALAQLPGVPTYFTDESHGSLHNNRTVAAAVSDILETGETDALPTRWAPARAGVIKTLDEEGVRRLVPDAAEKPRGAAVSDKELRYLIEELASPDAHDAVMPGAGERSYAPRLDRLVIGRRRQRRLDLRLALGSITEATSRAFVLGAFSGVTPTGAAQAVDARLGGAIAEFTQRRMFSANVGEVFVLPTGNHALRTDVVLFAGLGPFDRFDDGVLELVAENVIRTFIATGVDDFATVLISGGSGRNTGAAVRGLLSGFLRGLLDADKEQNFRRVTLCETDPGRYASIKEEVYRLAGMELFGEVEVNFEEATLPAPAEVVAPARGLAAPAEAPVYLMVREEQLANGEQEFQSSVLTTGGKATVIVGRKPVDRAGLERLLAGIGTRSFTFQKLDSFGRQLARLVLTGDVAAALGGLRKHHLVIVHDAPSSRIPWETIWLGDSAPAAEAGLSRRYMAENLSVAKWLEQRRQNPALAILLVVNPTADLDGAEAEGERIRELFGTHPSVRIVERRREQASKPALLKDFSSGLYDVIHYAGHAYFDQENVSRSGILCHGRQVLSGADLAGLGRLPSLIFFNACEAGRIRRANPEAPKRLSQRARVEQNVGLAEAFLRGGAANYLGTYWPVGDESAKTFAEVFYKRLMNGSPLGDAVLAARRSVRDLRSLDWADYILYGSPEFVLKLKDRQ